MRNYAKISLNLLIYNETLKNFALWADFTKNAIVILECLGVPANTPSLFFWNDTPSQTQLRNQSNQILIVIEPMIDGILSTLHPHFQEKKPSFHFKHN
jgi:hypothetical protein